MCPVFCQAFHGALNHTMELKFAILMVAACVCGSYRNSSKLREPYTENLGRPVEKEGNEKVFHVPLYMMQGHNEIIAGK